MKNLLSQYTPNKACGANGTISGACYSFCPISFSIYEEWTHLRPYLGSRLLISCNFCPYPRRRCFCDVLCGHFSLSGAFYHAVFPSHELLSKMINLQYLQLYLFKYALRCMRNLTSQP